MPDKSLPETLFELVESSIDAEGVYPQHCVFIDKDGKVNMCAMALDGEQIMDIVIKQVRSGEAVELVVGIDMWTKEDQGTEFADVIVVCHFKDGDWKVGVIDYQNSPRIVSPLRWDNRHWTTVMRRRLGIEE